MSLLPYNPDAFHDLTDELDALRTRLDYRGPLPRAWEGRLRRDLEVEAVAASTIMEGVDVTVEEVRRILAGERPPDVPNEELELVEGYRDAMSFVLRRADDPAFSWDKGLVVSLHDRVLAGRHGLGAGSLRTEKPAYLTNRLTGEQVFLPPAGDQVPVLVEELCARMEEGHPHAATAAAWIHVAVAAVHPFRDGNGRCARILSSLAMYREGFKRPEFTSLEEWWGRHLSDYYELFDCLGTEFDGNTDVTPFITGHIEAQLSQVRALDITLRAQQQIWTAVEESAEDARLDRRLANALWDAFFGREVTAGYYRSLADVSPATATNDLAAAVASGLLRAVGQRRGRRYFAGEELFSSVAGSFFIELTSLDEAREQIIGELSRRLTLSGEAFGFSRRPLQGS